MVDALLQVAASGRIGIAFVALDRMKARGDRSATAPSQRMNDVHIRPVYAAKRSNRVR
jgi:hypothetical protein